MTEYSRPANAEVGTLTLDGLGSMVDHFLQDFKPTPAQQIFLDAERDRVLYGVGIAPIPWRTKINGEWNNVAGTAEGTMKKASTKKPPRATLASKLETAEAVGRERGWYEGKRHAEQQYEAEKAAFAQRQQSAKLQVVQAMAQALDANAHAMQAMANLVDALGLR